MSDLPVTLKRIHAQRLREVYEMLGKHWPKISARSTSLVWRAQHTLSVRHNSKRFEATIQISPANV